MRAKFIINPMSGKQNFLKDIESIVGCLVMNQVVSHVDVAYTEHEGDAMKEAAKLRNGDYDFVVSVGGDGTLNDVVNGLMQNNCQIPLAVVSVGTANDFATYMNLPQTSQAFCQMIMEFKRRRIDVGRLNDRYFVNAVVGGLWANKSYKASPESKAVLGKMAYYVNGAVNLKNGAQPTRLSFRSREFRKEEDAIMFIITNTRSVGGMRQIIPEASPDDGYLDLIIVRKMDLGQIPGLGLHALKKGYLSHPKIRHLKIKQVEVKTLADEKFPVECDGQWVGNLPVKISIVPKAIEILVP